MPEPLPAPQYIRGASWAKNIGVEIKIARGKIVRGLSALKQAWDFHVGQAGNAAGEILHLIGELFIDAPRGFVDRRAHQVLQHLVVLAGENLRLDTHVHDLLLAVHLHGDHAAAGGSLHRHGIHLPLQIILQLLESREHLLESADFHQFSSGRCFTSAIFPPKRCSIDFTIGSRSNCARNSCVAEPAREAEAAAAATASSLAQTRTARPSTLLEAIRTFSSASRPSSISANARLFDEK